MRGHPQGVCHTPKFDTAEVFAMWLTPSECQGIYSFGVSVTMSISECQMTLLKTLLACQLTQHWCQQDISIFATISKHVKGVIKHL